ncbi:alpha/beta fold hydrolase [Dyella silvatica]|uniref:alpha/beta fold hydrolase n=1 Tax=Dyella silvatica TaxID=2992128 RepID=UPI00224F6E2D|nr:alpha/beta hydrolase [Dyella silvatica]
MNTVEPTLVLMPGLDGSGELFESFEALLPAELARCRISYAASLPAAIDAYVEHVQAQLPAHGPLIVIAESFSGPTAIQLAQQLGNRLKALILCASFASTPHPLTSLASRLPVSLLAPIKKHRQLLRQTCMGTQAPASVVERLSQTLQHLDGRIIQQRLRLLASIDSTRQLQALNLPMLLLQATNDWLVTTKAQRQLEAAAPRAQIIRIAGPHFLLQALPEICWQRIQTWMKQHALLSRPDDLPTASGPLKMSHSP